MTVDGDTIRVVMRWLTDYWLWFVAAAGATLSFYNFLKTSYPRSARVVGAPFKVVGWCIAAPYRWVRWSWRQGWRGVDGVSLGPIARRKMKRHADMARTIHEVIREVTDPQFEAGRAASLAQHNDQNERIAEVAGQVAGLSDRMAGVEKLYKRVDSIEDLVTQPARRKAPK